MNRTNSAVAVSVAVPLNQLYYLYQHADMSFGWKVFIQLGNFILSWWVIIVLFAAIPRLAVVVCERGLDAQIGSVIGIIYMAYALTVQLGQMLEGLVSIGITCYTAATRKPPAHQSLNQDQVDQMKTRLRAL